MPPELKVKTAAELLDEWNRLAGADPSDPADLKTGNVEGLQFKAYLTEMLGVEAAEVEDPADASELLAWTEKHLDLLRKADDSAKAAQIKRAKRYNIAIKDGGSVTMPAKWKSAGLKDSDFGDPVNYGFPIHDKTHADNAMSRLGQDDVKKKYTTGELAIIKDRVQSAQKRFGTEAAKFKSPDERMAVCGIPKMMDDPACPDELKEFADDPNAWGDFTNYRLFCGTDEAAAKAFTDAAVATDISPDQRALMIARISQSTNLRMAEALRKQSQEFADRLAPKAAGDPTQTQTDPTNPVKDPPVKKEGDGEGDDIEKDFTYSTRWALQDLCESFVRTLQGLDTLGEAAGGDGLDPATAKTLLDQLTAGLSAILAGALQSPNDLPGGSGDPLGDMVGDLVELAAVVEIVKTSAPDLADEFEAKAGRRHSAKDQAALMKAHTGIVEAGFDGCTPVTKQHGVTTTGAGAPPAHDKNLTMDERDTEIATLRAALQTAKAAGYAPSTAVPSPTDGEDVMRRLEDLEGRYADLNTKSQEDRDALDQRDVLIATLEERLRATAKPDPFAPTQKTRTDDRGPVPGAKVVDLSDAPKRLPVESTHRPNPLNR